MQNLVNLNHFVDVAHAAKKRYLRPPPRARALPGDLPGPPAGPRRRGTRRVVANFLQIFGKMLLVFGCIGTDFCKQIRVLKHFQNLPDYLAKMFEIWRHFANFARLNLICKNVAELSQKLLLFKTDFLQIF